MGDSSRMRTAALLSAVLLLPALGNAQPVSVQLGDHGGTATLNRSDSGGYTWNGQTVNDGFVVIGGNGLQYVLTVSGERPVARFLQGLVRVALGSGGSAITLKQIETGGFSWGGEPVTSGYVVTAAEGTVYTLVRSGGRWQAQPSSQRISVRLGRSGESVSIFRSRDGSYSYLGRPLRAGLRARDSAGISYRFALRNGAWHLDPVSVGTPDPGNRGTTPAPIDSLAYDRRGAYVGMKPTLTVASGTNGDTSIRIGGVDFPLTELARDGGVNRSTTFAQHAADVIATVRENLDTFRSLYEDDASGLRDIMQSRWRAARQALADLVGDSTANRVLGYTLPMRGTRVNVRTADGRLEDAQLALSSIRDFRSAVDGGIFDGGAIDLADVDDAFDAVRSATILGFGTTPNTRFGAYMRLKRANRWDDDLKLLNRTEGLDTFAYSPLDASYRPALPSFGQATFVGRTVAVQPDEPSESYAGTVELNVLLNSNRVGVTIRDLVSDSGTSWRFGLWRPESIVLPAARLNRSVGSFDSVAASSYAVVNYPFAAGGPRPRRLRGELEGRFVGEGAQPGGAAIGTWEISESSTRPILAGAFGAEYDRSPDRRVPAVDDSGTASRTHLEVAPDSDGAIRVGGSDPHGEDFEFDVSELYSSGFAARQGTPLVDLAKEEIENQIRILDFWTDLSSSDSTLQPRRTKIWSDSNAALRRVFGSAYPARTLLGTYPSGPRRDNEARRILREAADALESRATLQDSLATDGIFSTARRLVSDVDDLFDIRLYSMRVDFGHTNYGRFGVWAKTVGRSARAGAESDGASSFAYSPLRQTTYFSGDLSYPSGGVGYYEGDTLAVEQSPLARVFTGRIGLTVQWGARLSSARVNSVIRDLRTIDSEDPLVYRNAAVDEIIFRGVPVTSSNPRAGIGFSSSNPEVRVRYFNFGRSDARWSGSRTFTGKFVGESIDGPLGVIGTWSLGPSYATSSLKGSFSADWTP